MDQLLPSAGCENVKSWAGMQPLMGSQQQQEALGNSRLLMDQLLPSAAAAMQDLASGRHRAYGLEQDRATHETDQEKRFGWG